MTGGTLLVACCLGSMAVAQQQELDFSKIKVAQSSTAKGDKALRADKFEAAEKHFRDAIAADKDFPPSYLGLGSALVAQQRFPEAIEALQEAERRYVVWKSLLENAKMRHRELTLDRQQQTKDMLAETKTKAKLDRGFADKPEVARLIQRLELDVMKLSATRDANERIDSEDVAAIPPQVFYLEGISHLRTGQRDDGIALLEIALLLDDTHALSHYNLAVALFSAGRVQEAKEHLDAAIAGGVQPPPAFVRDVDRALAAAGAAPG